MKSGEQKLIEREIQINRDYLAQVKVILIGVPDDIEQIDTISDLPVPQLRFKSVNYIH